MMIRPAELAAIRAGTIDLAFRRWARPRVVVGTRMRTSVGLRRGHLGGAGERPEPARRGRPPGRGAVADGAQGGTGRAVRRAGLADRAAPTPDPTRVRRCARPSRTPTSSPRSPRGWTASTPRRRTARGRGETLDLIDLHPDRARPGPGRAGGARDGRLQEGRPQAQGARAHRVAGDRLPALPARRGGRRRRPARPAQRPRRASRDAALPRAIGAPGDAGPARGRDHHPRAGRRPYPKPTWPPCTGSGRSPSHACVRRWRSRATRLRRRPVLRRSVGEQPHAERSHQDRDRGVEHPPGTGRAKSPRSRRAP